MLLGNVFNGKDAFSIGMADYVIHHNEDLESEVLKIINDVKKCSPNAIAVTKKVLNSHYNIETSHAAKLFSQCIVHEEGREGFASFFEKKKTILESKGLKMKFNDEHNALYKTVKVLHLMKSNPSQKNGKKMNNSQLMSCLKKWGELDLLGITKNQENGGMGLDYS